MLVLAPWCWDPVLVDCAGAPETVAEYRLEAAQLTRIPSSCCCDDDGNPVDCSSYIQGPWQLLEEIIPSGSTAAPVCSSLDVPTPPLGDVFLLRVRAVDTAGQVDGCP